MPFLPPNQQRQSTEVTVYAVSQKTTLMFNAITSIHTNRFLVISGGDVAESMLSNGDLFSHVT